MYIYKECIVFIMSITSNDIEGFGVPESERPARIQNPFIEYRICQHCGEEIGHRPFTRDWEHVNPNPKECEKPFPNIGTCMCNECDL